MQNHFCPKHKSLFNDFFYKNTLLFNIWFSFSLRNTSLVPWCSSHWNLALVHSAAVSSSLSTSLLTNSCEFIILYFDFGLCLIVVLIRMKLLILFCFCDNWCSVIREFLLFVGSWSNFVWERGCKTHFVRNFACWGRWVVGGIFGENMCVAIFLSGVYILAGSIRFVIST